MFAGASRVRRCACLCGQRRFVGEYVGQGGGAGARFGARCACVREQGEQFTAMMPRIRNNVTLLLSSKKASELQPKEGKEQLAHQIADEINSAINPPARNKRGEMVPPDGPVTSVLFTSFIIQ